MCRRAHSVAAARASGSAAAIAAGARVRSARAVSFPSRCLVPASVVPDRSGRVHSHSPVDLARLRPLMDRTRGVPTVNIGLIDGPVAVGHPAFGDAAIRGIGVDAACRRESSDACVHGTFVAGILVASRESGAPGLCPGCTLIVRSIFTESSSGHEPMPSASVDQLAGAIVDSVSAGARVVNVSAALAEPSCRSDRGMRDALDYAAARGALVVVAAGNQGELGSSVITRHPWVVPVVACDQSGRPMRESNLSRTIAQNGILAPGDRIVSLSASGGLRIFSGTSAAAPFVTGAIALLWSLFPAASGAELRLAITGMLAARRGTIVPPPLDASAALGSLAARVPGGVP
jgi:subtilisin family serine protease